MQATVNNYRLTGVPGGVPHGFDFDGDDTDEVTLPLSTEAPEYNQVSLTIYDSTGRISKTVSHYDGSDLGNPANTFTTEGYNFVSAVEYDAAGNVLKTITNFDPSLSEGYEFHLDLVPDPNGDKETLLRVDPAMPDRNQLTCTEYDALSRPVQTWTACVPDDSGEYDDYLTSGSNLYNLPSRTYYDKMGRQSISVRNYEDPENDGELVLSSTRNFVTRTYYDELGQTKTVTRQVEETERITTAYRYNNLGQLVLTFENYTGGAPLCIQTPGAAADTNICTTYTYDQAGNLLSTKLGNGSTTEYQYDDARGQMTRETVDPMGEALVTTYEYDAAGNQVYMTRAPGAGDDEQVTYTLYDRLGRTIALDYEGLDTDVVFSYDAWGNRLTMNDTQADGRWAYHYDDMNRLEAVCSELPDAVSEDTWVGGDCTGSVVAYTYFADGARETLTYPGSTSIDYIYDDAGRLDTVENPFGTGVANYGYDGVDLTGAALPNGASTTNTYDTAGRLVQILNEVGQDNLSSFAYGLDDLGNRTGTSETLSTPSGELMSLQESTQTPAPGTTPTLMAAPTATEAPTVTPTPTEAPTVEPLNPTVEPLDPTVEPLNATVTLAATPTTTPAETMAPTEAPTFVPSATETPALAEAPLTLLAAEGEHHWYYDYDDLSRVIYACSEWNATAEDCEGDEWTYTYDRAGNLLRFDKWDATTNTVDTTTRYIVNGANQIACLDEDQNGTCGITENWQYDPYGNLKSDGTNTYTYDDANRLSAVGTANYAYNGDGDRISQTVGGIRTTYVLDTATPLTMVLSETNTTTSVTIRYWHGLDTLAQSDGTTAEYFTYDGLGSVRQLVDEAGSVGLAQTFDPYGNGYAREGSASSSFGYSGEQTDSNGFVYLRARYYAPGQGRFFQRDTFRGMPNYPLTLNPYMYGLGNPILYTDPSGHFVTVALGAFLGLVIGGLGSYAYANTIYNWALTGQCGCEKSDWAHRTNKERFAQDMAFYGAMFGMVMGGVAGSGGLGLGAVSLVGGGLSGYQIGNALGRMATEGITPCNYLDFSLGVIGAMMAVTGMAGVGSPTMGIPWPAGSSLNFGSIGGGIAAGEMAGAWATVLVPSVSAVGATAATAVNTAMVLMAAGNGGGHVFGQGGAQFTSKTYWPKRGQPGNASELRLDAENPAPGERSGQLHVNDDVAGQKYHYNPETGWFNNMPKGLSKILSKNPQFIRGMENALSALGEPPIINPPQ